MEDSMMEMVAGQYGITMFPLKPVIGMAYVPYQRNGSDIYVPEQGLEAGTMFVNLDKPFEGETVGDNK